MKTKIHIPLTDFKQINQTLRKSGVKFYPFHRKNDGYEIEFTPQNHPLVSYLMLKYDGVKVMQNE